MEIIFKKSFLKNLKVTPKHIQECAREIIEKLETSKNLVSSGFDCKRMEGQKKNENYYRIRIGNWRMGIEYLDPNVALITILHRSTIYKQFPPK